MEWLDIQSVKVTGKGKQMLEYWQDEIWPRVEYWGDCQIVITYLTSERITKEE